MLFSTLLAGLSLAGLVSAIPVSQIQRRSTTGEVVVYWGQNGGGTVENNDLSYYCSNNAGIDILVLAFLYSFGEQGNIPGGTIGQSCYISDQGEGENCDDLASAIATCQSAGVKVILSLGGSAAAYSLSSNSQASAIGQYLWESYGNSGNTTVQRPFGKTFVNGFDFDIEENDGYSQYFPAMISTLRSAFSSDSSNKYYITGAPQCPLPEPNMGIIIGNATFDYLWPQFYNNNNYTYPCALPFNGNAAFNYDQWVNFTASTPSKDASIFIGVPAAPLAADGGPEGETYYITPDQLSQLIGQYGTATRFGGIMMWNCGFSDSNVNDGCTYAQQAYSILTTGKPCSGGSGGSGNTSTTTSTGTTAPTSTSTPSSHTSAPATTTTGSQPTSTGSGVAGQYDQCGGTGWTGATQCQSGWTCTEISPAYSQCDPAS